MIQYTPLPRYPSVMRDISLLLNRTVSLDEILNAVRSQHVADCRNVMLVGTFAGGAVLAAMRPRAGRPTGSLTTPSIDKEHI